MRITDGLGWLSRQDVGARLAAARGRSRPAARPGSRPASFRSHVTARGALLAMVIISLLACLLGAWQHLDVLAGLGFCLSCVLAPVYARREAMPYLVISAPLTFLVAELITQALTAQGDSTHGSTLSVLEGTFLTLADVAPWLFAGTAICVVIALFRGLPQSVRELRASLRGEPPAAASQRSGQLPSRSRERAGL